MPILQHPRHEPLRSGRLRNWMQRQAKGRLFFQVVRRTSTKTIRCTVSCVFRPRRRPPKHAKTCHYMPAGRHGHASDMPRDTPFHARDMPVGRQKSPTACHRHARRMPSACPPHALDMPENRQKPPKHAPLIPAEAGTQALLSEPQMAPTRGTKTQKTPGSREFSNEVQHSVSGVLRWDASTSSCRWRSAVRLPNYTGLGARSGRSLQLWIASHRRYRAS